MKTMSIIKGPKPIMIKKGIYSLKGFETYSNRRFSSNLPKIRIKNINFKEIERGVYTIPNYNKNNKNRFLNKKRSNRKSNIFDDIF